MRSTYWLTAALLCTLSTACSSESISEPELTAESTSVQSPQVAQGIDAVHAEFARYSESLLQRMLARNPEWQISAGRYDNAHLVTLPNAARRADDLAFVETELSRLSATDPALLSPDLRIDYALLRNRLQSMRWYLTEFKDWE